MRDLVTHEIILWSQKKLHKKPIQIFSLFAPLDTSITKKNHKAMSYESIFSHFVQSIKNLISAMQLNLI